MRIALVSPGYPPAPGGVEAVVAHTARALARSGARVEVLAQQSGGCDVPWAAEECGGVLVRRFPATSSTTYPIAPGLWRHLRRYRSRYDIVHGHNYHCVAAAGAALVVRGDRSGPRFVFSPHYHGGGHDALSSLMHLAYRPLGHATLGRAAAVVCVSRAEADLVAEHFPFAAQRITVIPHAVDTTALAAAEPWPSQPPTVLSAGRLERYKRVDRLLAAFRLVPEPTRLVVAGDGPDRERLENLSTRYGLAARVRFLGRVDDVALARWMRTARAFCSLSEHEAFGLAPAEAIAAGAAVVLSDIAAHRELIPAGSGALVGPHEGDAQIASALARSLDQGSQELCPVTRGWDDVAAALGDVYEHVLGTGLGEER